MNINSIVQQLADEIRGGKVAEETIGDYVNTATYDVHTAILDELGDCDLSEPRPDLSAGWPRVREQLAYNALYRAVMENASKPADDCEARDYADGVRVGVCTCDARLNHAVKGGAS